MIKTQPFAHFAGMLVAELRKSAPPTEQLEAVMEELCGQYYPMELWESTILPARVSGYRPQLLDNLLAQGSYYWKIKDQDQLAFLPYEEADWEAEVPQGETEQEQAICKMLGQRGACFARLLTQENSRSRPK